MIRKYQQIIAVILISLFVAACGKTGDLYLEDTNTQKQGEEVTPDLYKNQN